MQFVVNENIVQPYAVEAETAEEAISARERGEGVPLPSRNVSRSAAQRVAAASSSAATQTAASSKPPAKST